MPNNFVRRQQRKHSERGENNLRWEDDKNKLYLWIYSNIAAAIVVGAIIISGNKQTAQPQTTTTTTCKTVQQTYYRNETYVEYPSSYTTIYQQSNIPILSNQPATIAVTLHDNSKYIVTFTSDVYAHHMVLDTQNKINFESRVVYNTGMRDNWNIYGKYSRS